MPTVNEHLPEDHRDHITNFGDVRDEAHVPPGNSSEGPAPTQDELAAANEAVEEARGTVVGDASVTDEEDLLVQPHQGSSSWYSDPDAVSSDATQAVQPGYDTGEEPEAEVEGLSIGSTTGPEPEPEIFDPSVHTVSEVEAYVKAYPGELARILEAEHEGNARSSLITKLENMEA